MSKKTLVLNRDPVYRNLQNELRRRIHQGDWTKGEMIPSRRALADEFQVSVPTVQKAVADMVSEGILRVNAKRGTYVFGDPDPSPDDLPDIKRNMRRGVMDDVLITPLDAHVGLVAEIRPGSTSDLANPWPFVIIHEAEHTLAQYGFQSRFYNRYATYRHMSGAQGTLSNEENALSNRALLEAVLAEQPAAVILHESVIVGENPDIVQQVFEAGVQPIVVGYKSYGPDAISIMYDSTNAGYQATKHLIDVGCKRILFFAPYHAEWEEARAAGVRMAIKASSLPNAALTEAVGSETVEAVVGRVIDQHPHIPAAYDFATKVIASYSELDGVVAVNDDAAFGFIRAAEERGLKFGVDYRIIAFDDSPESQALGLSTMHPPCASMGREAARAVARVLRGQDDLASVVLNSRLVVRASSVGIS